MTLESLRRVVVATHDHLGAGPLADLVGQPVGAVLGILRYDVAVPSMRVGRRQHGEVRQGFLVQPAHVYGALGALKVCLDRLAKFQALKIALFDASLAISGLRDPVELVEWITETWGLPLAVTPSGKWIKGDAGGMTAKQAGQWLTEFQALELQARWVHSGCLIRLLGCLLELRAGQDLDEEDDDEGLGDIVRRREGRGAIVHRSPREILEQHPAREWQTKASARHSGPPRLLPYCLTEESYDDLLALIDSVLEMPDYLLFACNTLSKDRATAEFSRLWAQYVPSPLPASTTSLYAARWGSVLAPVYSHLYEAVAEQGEETDLALLREVMASFILLRRGRPGQSLLPEVFAGDIPDARYLDPLEHPEVWR